ncbi:MAG: hypothetical protein R3324_11485, partial [Halobacteriales archaeon]|nr:hypothetical protein [Halobacteriales archaeon]
GSDIDAQDAEQFGVESRLKERDTPEHELLKDELERTVMKRKMQGDFDEMILPNYKQIIEERVGK